MKNFAKQLAVAAAALGFVAIAGAWRGPTHQPPAGNVAAPVNISSSAQSKQGTLGVGGLGVFGKAFISPTAGYTPAANLQLGVNGAIGASAYCDRNGQNCVTSLGVTSATGTEAAAPGAARAWATFKNVGGSASLIGDAYGVRSVGSAAGVSNFAYYDTIVSFEEPVLASGYAVVASPAFNSGSGRLDGAVLDWVCIWSKVSDSSLGVHCAYPGYGAYGNSIVSVVVF